MRNNKTGNVCSEMFNTCMDIYNNYEQYNIGGNKKTMDDKLLAVAMATSDCYPIKSNGYCHLCIYNRENVRINIYHKKLFYKDAEKSVWKKSCICHFGSKRTKSAIYKREVNNLGLLLDARSNKQTPYLANEMRYYANSIKEELSCFIKKVYLYIKAHV